MPTALNNPNKLQEIKLALDGLHEILSLKDIGCFDELPENQETLQGNSEEKAQYVYEKYNIPCFADDTGLEIDTLNGRPGVYSARYSGPECDSEKNMFKLLLELAGNSNRTGQFRTVICLKTESGTEYFEGICKGEITEQKSGNSGFGYDPIFKPEGYEKTFSEMDMQLKNKISHRGLAVKKLIQFLQKK